jgi:hypothetical protein
LGLRRRSQRGVDTAAAGVFADRGDLVVAAGDRHSALGLGASHGALVEVGGEDCRPGQGV